MKLRNIIFGLFASVAVLVSCNPDEEFLGPASLKANVTTLNVGADAGSTATFLIKATRDWSIALSGDAAENLTVSPSQGSGSGEEIAITVTAEAANEMRAKFANLTITSGNLTPVTVTVTNEGKITGPYTIAELRAYPIGTTLPSGATLEAVVLNDVNLKNFSQQSIYVQDATGGITLRLAEYGAYTYARGSKLTVDLEGTTTAEYGGVRQLNNVKKSGIAETASETAPTPIEATVEDFLANKYEGQYIALSKVQFVSTELEKNFVEPKDEKEPDKYGTTSIKFEVEGYDNIFIVYSYCYGSQDETYPLASAPVPDGSGILKGIASRYVDDDENVTYQIVLTGEADYSGLTGERFVPASYIDINKTSEALPPVAGKYPLEITSSMDWTIEENADWLTLDKSSGSGSDKVEITFDAYDSTEPREATVVVKGDGVEKTLTLTQKAGEVLTIEQFEAKENGDPTYYRIRGKIVKIDDPEKGRIYINDGTGDTQFYVAGVKVDKYSTTDDFATLGLKLGDEITVEGTKGQNSGGTKNRALNAYYISHVAAPEVQVSTVAQINASEKGTIVKAEGTVVAKSKKGFMLADANKDAIYVNVNDIPDVEVGNKVTVEGAKDSYYGTHRISSPEFVVTDNTTAAPAHPDLNELADAVAVDALKTYDNAWDGTDYVEVKYFKVTGTLGNSVFVNVGEAERSFKIENSFDSYSGLNGQTVTLTGYIYGYNTNSKYFQVMATSVVFENYLIAADVEVAATATSAKIAVKSNTSWSISGTSDWASLGATSGTGNQEVEVTFEAYAATDVDRTATFTLQAEGLEPVTVTLTQKKVAAVVNGVTDVLDYAFAGMPGTSSYADWSKESSVSGAGYSGNNCQLGENSVKFLQFRSSGNSGIVTTKSGGKVKKVIVCWTGSDKTNTASRSLDVYVSNTAYSAVSDLYDVNKAGTNVGSSVFNTAGQVTEIDIEGEYSFVGLRSKDGAIYISSIKIVWE